jgi:nucleotide-binding universal stress UspA family protein
MAGQSATRGNHVNAPARAVHEFLRSHMSKLTSAWPKRVFVVGVDFSEFADAALREAYELTKLQSGAELHAVHVVSTRALMTFDDGPLVSPPDLDAIAPKLEQHVRDRLMLRNEAPSASPRIVTHLRAGDAAREIAQLAADLDAGAIVVGTHGRRGIVRMMLGSVAEKVLRYATCPVIVVSPNGHQIESARAQQLHAP